MSPLSILGLASSALAAVIPSITIAGFQNPIVAPSRGGGATCVSGTVSVSVNVPNAQKINFVVPNNQTGATQTFVSFVSANSNLVPSVLGGPMTVANTYSIGASLCYPTGLSAPSTVQLASHGVGFDRYYWDFAPGYSYVDYAASQGYATFIYDRLGQGTSQKADPLVDVQTAVEAEILHQLANMVRSGTFGGLTPKNVIGVGHSFGSILTESITANYPAVFDAAVLTGFSLDQSGFPAFLSGLNLAIANQNNPLRFGTLPNGYITTDTAIGNQIGFFHFPGFDPSILTAATAQKGTATYGEFFTIGLVGKPATSYTGPVIVVNGQQDLPFCAGDCTQGQSQAVLAALYPAARASSTTYLAPNCGHGINLQYAAQGAYQAIQSFVKSNGY